MAKVALIGSTGFVGTALLKELIKRGHHVTAVARNVDKVIASHLVEPRPANVMNVEALSNVMKGSDVVVSAYNAGWANPNIYEDFLAGSRAIQSATKQAGIHRLFVVGGAGSLYVQGTQLVDQQDFPEAFKAGATAARDYLNELKNEKQIDWVFISPPIEFGPNGPTKRTGNYRVGTDEPIFNHEGHSIISAADLAKAVVDEIENPAHRKTRFTIGY
jgi:putative NADH-flavin reductase